MVTSNMIHRWFRVKDDKPPRMRDMPKPVVRNRIYRQYGPYVLTVASSCGYAAKQRLKPDEKETHLIRGGFVSAQLYRMPDTKTPIFARKWQADSWREAQAELAPLVRHLKSLGPVAVDGVTRIVLRLPPATL